MAESDWLPYAYMAGQAASAYGQAQDSEEARKNQFRIASMGNQTTRDLGASSAAAREPNMLAFRQQQAARAAMMGGLRNYQVNAPSELQGFTPQITGGYQIPEGGFDQNTLNFYSPESRLATEQSYYGAMAPLMQAPTLQSSYGGQAAGLDQNLLAQRQQALAAQSLATQQGTQGTPWYQKLAGVATGPALKALMKYLPGLGKGKDKGGEKSTAPSKAGDYPGGGGSTQYDWMNYPGGSAKDPWQDYDYSSYANTPPGYPGVSVSGRGYIDNPFWPWRSGPLPYNP